MLRTISHAEAAAEDTLLTRAREQLAIEEADRDAELRRAAEAIDDPYTWDAACNALARADLRVAILRRYIAALERETC